MRKIERVYYFGRERVCVDAALEVMSRVQMKSYYRAAVTKVRTNNTNAYCYFCINTKYVKDLINTLFSPKLDSCWRLSVECYLILEQNCTRMNKYPYFLNNLKLNNLVFLLHFLMHIALYINVCAGLLTEALCDRWLKVPTL